MASFLLRTFSAGLFAIAVASTARAETGPRSAHAAVREDAFSVVAEIHARPGREEELRAATLPLIDLVRSDPQEPPLRPAGGPVLLRPPRLLRGIRERGRFQAHNAQLYVTAWLPSFPTWCSAVCRP